MTRSGEVRNPVQNVAAPTNHDLRVGKSILSSHRLSLRFRDETLVVTEAARGAPEKAEEEGKVAKAIKLMSFIVDCGR